MMREKTTPLPAVKGFRFIPWGTDSRGTVTAVSLRTVTFAYRHDPERTHSMHRDEFSTRFARPA